ncbi:MAG TPA: DUF748 domain-containing protein [Bacteroidia bacterium]
MQQFKIFKKQRSIFRSLIRLFAIAISAILIILLICSPIAKHLIEKYDVKYTGREIKIDWAYINPFTGTIYLSNPKIYELNSDTLALSANSISARINISRLFQKTVDIGTLELDQPNWFIRQKGNKRDLNFKDLIERFSADPNSTKSSKTHFIIQKLKINKGVFFYTENITPVSYYVREVDIESSPIGWKADTIIFNYSFLSGAESGSMQGSFSINVNNLKYRLSSKVNRYSMQILEQYLKSMSNNGRFAASLYADIIATGSLKHARDLKVNGKVNIADMHFGKDSIPDYAAFEQLSLDIIDLQPDKGKYFFDTILLDKPYFKYERYHHLDNYQDVFGAKGSKVIAASGNPERFNLILEIASYIEKLSKDFFDSYYRVGRISISNANFEYNDFTLTEDFSVATSPLFLLADSVNKDKERVNARFWTDIQPQGNFLILLSINPQDSSNFDFYYQLDSFSLPVLNPYLVKYASFPLKSGKLKVEGSWKVRDGNITSNNHLQIDNPQLGERSRQKGTKWLPMPLIMAVVRDNEKQIDYSIPITGNLKHPKLHWKDVVSDISRNILTKPFTYLFKTKKTAKKQR